LLEKMSASDVEILPYPLQRYLVRHLAVSAEKAGRPELMQMLAGQSANLISHPSAAELLDDLVSGVAAIAAPVQEWAAARERSTP
jgi:nitronate monooxygenase